MALILFFIDARSSLLTNKLADSRAKIQHGSLPVIVGAGRGGIEGMPPLQVCQQCLAWLAFR